MAEKKKSFVMYHDYITHFEMLSKDEQADLIMLILRYVNGADLNMDELSGGVRMAFSFIRFRLDEDFEKYEEVRKKRSEAAKAGKSKQLHTNAGKSKQLYANATDNVNVDVDVDVNDNENEGEDVVVVVSEDDVVSVVVEDEAQPPEAACAEWEIDGTTETTTEPAQETEFTVPTIGEVREYCAERGSCIDPQRFYDYYSGNGWRAGKNPMRDWRAAVRFWEGRERNKPSGNSSPPLQHSCPSYDFGEIQERTLAKYRDL